MASSEPFDAKAIPTPAQISKASEIEVYDIEGKKATFGSLFEKEGKTVVVFIRHFFCGMCQAYVENLSKVSSSSLETAGARLIIIGCGEWQPIKAYHETTNFTQGKIYAEPTRNLYRTLGMTLENLEGVPKGQPKPFYISHFSTIGNVFKSIWRGPLKHPSLIGKQGNIQQLGGEFVFGFSEDGKTLECTFASRMKNTVDHIPVAELMRLAGVEYVESDETTEKATEPDPKPETVPPTSTTGTA